jgi:hypothetical protein
MAPTSSLPQSDHRRRTFPLLDDVTAAATALSGDVTAALAERLEELNTAHHDFRSGVHRAFMRVLTLAKRQDKRVMIFEEAIPGFNLILFKKDPQADTWKSRGKEPALADPAAPEIATSALIIGEFVKRTHHRVLVVESPDALFVFFPAEDARANLREMDLYLTD